MAQGLCGCAWASWGLCGCVWASWGLGFRAPALYGVMRAPMPPALYGVMRAHMPGGAALWMCLCPHARDMRPVPSLSACQCTGMCPSVWGAPTCAVWYGAVCMAPSDRELCGGMACTSQTSPPLPRASRRFHCLRVCDVPW